jgi:hypothetical protein
MGLLDDAIREHLELKRRRGADPNEIEQLEREALGPVRRPLHEPRDMLLEDDREPARSHDVEAAEGWGGPGEQGAPFDHDSEFDVEPPELESLHEREHHAVAGSSSAAPYDELAEQGYEPPTPAPAPEGEYEAPRHHEIAEEWEARRRQPYAEPGPVEPDTPAPAAPPPAPAASPRAGERQPPPYGDEFGEVDQETAEYDVEAQHARAPEADDVLEETPDFLQDAPDHDRLWFEQRPPRDFDLDG